MSDTNDMRREFEAWCKARRGINTSRDSTPPANGGTGEYESAHTNHAWWAWQAATERATALERERCAVVCQAMTTVSGTDDVERGWNAAVRRVSTAIRQGGALR